VNECHFTRIFRLVGSRDVLVVVEGALVVISALDEQLDDNELDDVE
jgi:hypothetical protein